MSTKEFTIHAYAHQIFGFNDQTFLLCFSRRNNWLRQRNNTNSRERKREEKR